MQVILKNIIKEIPSKVLKSSELIYSGKHWNISYKTYKYLYEISKYISWFYVYGFCANHFTIYINDLKNFTNIKEVNTFIKTKTIIYFKVSLNNQLSKYLKVLIIINSFLLLKYRILFSCSPKKPCLKKTLGPKIVLLL
ncbi:MAG: DUF1338 family protein [Campylobacteraceae bacterium]|nr:DUF1338 family protein [Campylobacteraceae bacterium]